MSNPTELPDLDSTDDARVYLVNFMMQHFSDKTFHRYILGHGRERNQLAGDFAWQMATALRKIEARRAQPEGEAPQAEALKVSTDQHEVSISAEKIDMSAQQAARAMRVIGGQRWSKEAEMTEGWLAAQQAAVPGALTLLNADELAALHRFQETCQDFDSGGYDVDKNMMKRLASIGVIESKGFNRYQFTEFGDYVVENQAPSAPGTPEAPAAALHPLQPLLQDAYGRVRFKRNAIVDHLATDKLNDLAAMDFPEEDWEQLAQLIGYSLHGFGTLSYVKDETYERAAAQPVVQRAAQLDGGQGEGEGEKA